MKLERTACRSESVSADRARYNKLLYVVDTCQANTMYSKFYSPGIISTGSSEIGESSYSVCTSNHHAANDPDFICSKSELNDSTTTTTISARQSSTRTRTTFSNTLSSWARLRKLHYKISQVFLILPVVDQPCMVLAAIKTPRNPSTLPSPIPVPIPGATAENG